MSRAPERSHPYSRFEAHPFEEPAAGSASDACAFCGEPRAQILHHPTRIRAARLLRGIDPGVPSAPRRRGAAS